MKLLRMAALLTMMGSATVASGQRPAEAAAMPMASQFITLGTKGGPTPMATRSEPANVILLGKRAYLVDVGDGAAEQLAKAGIGIDQVKAVFISHLHYDHVGGLSALIGLRQQIGIAARLTIYGPPGIKAMVAGLTAAMEPFARAGYGLEGQAYIAPASRVEAIELVDGNVIRVDAITATARQNSHYSFTAGSDMDRRYKSLAYRFDLPDRSIAYTGDTGPSAAMVELAKGADLLVSEMIDLKMTLGDLNRSEDGESQHVPHLAEHLAMQHLSPEQVGALARDAGAKAVVVTHVVAGSAKGADKLRYLAAIHQGFAGPAIIADDLEIF